MWRERAGRTHPTPTLTATAASVLAASWSSRKDGAEVTSSTFKLPAKAAFKAESVSEAAFTVTWGGTTKKACTAISAGSGGAWSCQGS